MTSTPFQGHFKYRKHCSCVIFQCVLFLIRQCKNYLQNCKKSWKESCACENLKVSKWRDERRNIFF